MASQHPGPSCPVLLPPVPWRDLLQQQRTDRTRGMQRCGPFCVAKTLRTIGNNEPKWDLCQSQLVLHSIVLQFLGRWCMIILHQWLATRLYTCKRELSLGCTAVQGPWQNLHGNLVNKVMIWSLDEFLTSLWLLIRFLHLFPHYFFFLVFL